MLDSTNYVEPFWQKVVTALRSGEFKQGAGRLRSPANVGGLEFCCLGVITESSGAVVHNEDYGYLCAEGVENLTLPEEAVKAIGWKLSKTGKIPYSVFKKHPDLTKQMLQEIGGRSSEFETFLRVNEDANYTLATFETKYPISALNDGGVSFGTLADLIEREPGVFFEQVEATLPEYEVL